MYQYWRDLLIEALWQSIQIWTLEGLLFMGIVAFLEFYLLRKREGQQAMIGQGKVWVKGLVIALMVWFPFFIGHAMYVSYARWSDVDSRRQIAENEIKELKESKVYPTTLVRFELPTTLRNKSRSGPFTTEETRIDISIRNQGPSLARNVHWKAKVDVYPTPTGNAEAEMYEDFIKSTPFKGGPVDLTVGEGSWSTFDIRRLSESDVSDLKRGILRLYVMGYIVYEDSNGTHEVESCRYIEPPGEEAIWANCARHNRNVPSTR